MKATPEIDHLDGQPALVFSRNDTHYPRAGVRGVVKVHPLDLASDDVRVEVSVTLPALFSAPAHERHIPVPDDDVRRMTQLRDGETYELEFDGVLD